MVLDLEAAAKDPIIQVGNVLLLVNIMDSWHQSSGGPGYKSRTRTSWRGARQNVEGCAYNHCIAPSVVLIFLTL